MAEPIVIYKPLTKIYLEIILGLILFLVIGYFVAELFLPSLVWDWPSILLSFIGLPVLVTAIGFYIGWSGKKSAVQYSDPTWTMEPVQMTIDDAKSLIKQNKRKYWRLVSNSSYWTFFIPIALLFFMAGFPFYIFIENPNLGGADPWFFSVALAVTFTVSSIGAFLATSNDATEDFDILLVREAIDLAKTQESVAGLSYVRVVFDKGELDGYEIYESPRVVSRISGIEKEAYVESWSDDLHTVTRVLCRLFEMGDNPQVVWWWMAQDRNFRKFVGNDEKGYYVKFPVKSPVKFPGVKDVKLVLENGVAILLLEWQKTRGINENATELLKELRVRQSEE